MANYTKIVDGKIIPLTDEEQLTREAEEKVWADGKADRNLAELRLQRNILLAETDYLALSDVTMSDAWKTYRQELRDITKTFKSMSDKDFKFPTKPTE
jgi:hypothetical protein